MSGLTDRLRQVAGQATPGPWAHDDGRPWVWNEEVASGWREHKARFMVTFDPQLVVAMLDVIDAAEQVHEYGFDCHGNLEDALARFREVAG